jgi:hypothetical protein
VHTYEVLPRKDKRGVDLISDALPFGRLWYDGPQAVANAIGYAQQYSRAHDAVIRVYDEAGNVIVTHSTLGNLTMFLRPGLLRARRSLSKGQCSSSLHNHKQ